MKELAKQKIPPNPCTGCVPPRRNSDCHGKCEEYISWEKNKNKILEARWKLKESVSYTSAFMMRIIKRNQLGK